MTRFRDEMEKAQLAWLRRALPGVAGGGSWQGKTYPQILLAKHRQSNLWSGLRTGGRFPLDDYLKAKAIQSHTGRDNLLSSWTLCANLYFPFGQDPDGLATVSRFVRAKVDDSITRAKAVELEYEHEEIALQPPKLLGETDGGRGTNQTSPDVAFLVEVAGGGDGAVLTEVKFTEHNFYPCSIRKTLSKAEKDRTCHDLVALKSDPQGLCGQHQVKRRRYWDHLARGCFHWGAGLPRCPAATAGYQLFRQHALAEGLARKSDLSLVVSSVAYDERNHGLMQSLKGTGIPDLRKDWEPVFRGKARFKVFTHQDWAKWVREDAERPAWCDGADGWLAYVTDRYGL